MSEFRSKPKSYRWLSWLLRLIIPIMAVPPLLWSLEAYPRLEPVPTRLESFVNQTDLVITEIGEPDEEFVPLPYQMWCMKGRDGILSGDKFVGFLFGLPDGYIVPVVFYEDEQGGELEQFYQDILEGEFEPEESNESVAYTPPPPSATPADIIASLGCDFKEPRTTLNMAIYGSGGILALLILFIGGFASFRFDFANSNPYPEYAGLAIASLITALLSQSVLMAVPLVISVGMTAFLALKRDVL
jgi:hypothetical protein